LNDVLKKEKFSVDIPKKSGASIRSLNTLSISDTSDLSLTAISDEEDLFVNFSFLKKVPATSFMPI
jgi:hypothetical protein